MDLLSGLWAAIPSLPRTLIAFAVVLGVLVFVHEMGHYLAARWRGVHVDAFSVGFGRPIWRRTDRHGTEWRISWIPLGGYVKLHGQETPADAPEEVRAAWRPGHTFHEKPVRDRAIIVGAGPVANFLLAILLFAGLFATLGKPTGNTTIAAVVENSAAAQAGLLPGDEILALDGNRVTRFEQVQRHIQPRANQPVEIRLSREGQEMVVTAVPRPREAAAAAGAASGAAGGASSAAAAPPPAASVGVLGVQAGAARFERLDPLSALVEGARQTADISWQSLVAIGEMITGQRGAEELGGPIRIAEVSGQAADLGLFPLVNLMALLSVSLGLLNLFPVPLLDGGHLLFYAAEAIRGRPLPPRAMEYGFRAGFAALVTLFLFATWNDIAHGAIGRWVAGLLG